MNVGVDAGVENRGKQEEGNVIKWYHHSVPTSGPPPKPEQESINESKCETTDIPTNGSEENVP